MKTQSPIMFAGYIIESGIVLLKGASGKIRRIGIGKLVNHDHLVARMSPEDALRIGSWHGAHFERNLWRRIGATS